MDAERWRRIRSIFRRALELRGESRPRFIEQVEDSELRREVGSLLARVDEADDFLDTPPWASTALGAVLAERYELIREIGQGGMAVVYEAVDRRLERTVAVKLLAAHPLALDMAERFRREARLAARLDHPGIVPIFDHGVDAGRLFLVMPRVRGETLRARLARGPLPEAEALSIVEQIADALGHSHGLGVVHRDIKPENLMITETPSGPVARMMDFGLARSLDDPRLTGAGTLIGTPTYMSPEQVSGHAVDGRSDVYSLGAVLYECLVGAAPFEGATHTVLRAVLHEEPVPPRRRGVAVSPSLERLVLACLAKDPKHRPADGRALRRALRGDGSPFFRRVSSRAASLGAAGLGAAGLGAAGLGAAGLGAAGLGVIGLALVMAGGGFGPTSDRRLPERQAPTASSAIPPPLERAWAAPMTTRRVRHAATLLQDGRVLVTGGTTWEPFLSIRLAAAEVYFPELDTWRALPDMAEIRDLHVAVLSRDGRPLAVGGEKVGSRMAGVEILDPGSHVWQPLAGLLTPRHSFAATVLLDGRILVAGGPTRSTELYDPAADTWRPIGDLSVERYNPTATRLADGRVLVVGGRSAGRKQHGSAELYDPADDRWTSAASLMRGRWLHSATLLRDHRVLVAGGDDSGGVVSVELYDPADDRWTPAAPMAQARNRHTATLLADGRVVVAGGNSNGRLASVELYDPDRDQWSAAPDLEHARLRHTATLLPDGRVLIAGGEGEETRSSLGSAELLDPRGPPIAMPASPPRSLAGMPRAALLPDNRVLVVGVPEPWIYDPASDRRQRASSPPEPRSGGGVAWLADGRLLWVGGRDAAGRPTARAAIFDPRTDRWAAAAPLGTARAGHTVTRLVDGRAVVSGGVDTDGVALADQEVYDLPSHRWTPATPLAEARVHHGAIALPDGGLWLVGGLDTDGEPLDRFEVFDAALEPVATQGRLFDARAHHAVLPWIEPDLDLVRILVIGGQADVPLASVEACHINDCQPLGRLEVARSRPSATRLADGRVLVAGGRGVDGPVGVTEVLQAGRKLWRRGPELAKSRIEPAAVLLADGSLFVVGDITRRIEPRPDLASIPRPTITEWPESAALGEPIVLKGRGFRAVSAGSGGLGGQDCPSDHPLVHLRSQVDGRRLYLPADPAVGWSATTFHTLPVHTLPPGPARLTVVTQAAWSLSRPVLIEPARKKSTRD